MALTLRSSAFDHGGAIPSKYTCDGADRSPPLEWGAVPDGTQSLVLIVDDPDAPDPAAPQLTYVHWVLYNLPPALNGLPEAFEPATLATVIGEGINDWRRTAYGGPCPPIGRHRYFHKLYALDTELRGLLRPTKADVERAMHGHILEQATLIGTYAR
jgi:Raf kinase inhibitor-like YbhB/YbcL family protein